MSKYYTGIGSRSCPEEFGETFDKISAYLVKKGYTLRSGGADGADKFWSEAQNKAGGKSEIYLPWIRFNDNDSQLLWSQENWDTAAETHPYWDNMGVNARCLMARNSAQVLGFDNKTPSSFVLCWTPDGERVGGTAQALRLADKYKIKIFNFGKVGALARFRTFCKKNLQ